ncbi:hypothetical protein PENNAL_c0413G05801, partial [Penicillium nalgiovense]
DNRAEGTPTGNKLVTEAITGSINPPIGAGSDGNGSAAASGASAAGDNGGAAVTGPIAAPLGEAYIPYKKGNGPFTSYRIVFLAGL